MLSLCSVGGRRWEEDTSRLFKVTRYKLTKVLVNSFSTFRLLKNLQSDIDDIAAMADVEAENLGDGGENENERDASGDSDDEEPFYYFDSLQPQVIFDANGDVTKNQVNRCCPGTAWIEPVSTRRWFMNNGRWTKVPSKKHVASTNNSACSAIWIHENAKRKGALNLVVRQFCQWVNNELLSLRDLPPNLICIHTVRTATH